MKIGFVGLGAMGAAMAKNLVAAGHEVTVYNRTRERAEAFARDAGANGGNVRVASDAKGAASDAEVVVSMLADDAALEEVTRGNSGIAAGLAKDAVHISSSTISVALSDRLAELHQAEGQGYVACPVFGRPDAAAARQLWLVNAGAPAHVARCQPVFEALGRGTTTLGDKASQANVVKLAGNFIIASMLEILGEAFALTRKSGVEAEVFTDVFVNVFCRSPIFENYAKRIAARGYEPAGFTTTLALKDVSFALAAGSATKVPLPVASVVRDHLLAAIAQGHGDLDWSALARHAAERAGLDG